MQHPLSRNLALRLRCAAGPHAGDADHLEAVDEGELRWREDDVAAQEFGVVIPRMQPWRREVQRSVAGRAPVCHLHTTAQRLQRHETVMKLTALSARGCGSEGGSGLGVITVWPPLLHHNSR